MWIYRRNEEIASNTEVYRKFYRNAKKAPKKWLGLDSGNCFNDLCSVMVFKQKSHKEISNKSLSKHVIVINCWEINIFGSNVAGGILTILYIWDVLLEGSEIVEKFVYNFALLSLWLLWYFALNINYFVKTFLQALNP